MIPTITPEMRVIIDAITLWTRILWKSAPPERPCRFSARIENALVASSLTGAGESAPARKEAEKIKVNIRLK